MMYRTGIKIQAAEVLSRLKSKGKDNIESSTTFFLLSLTSMRTYVKQSKLYHIVYVGYMIKNQKPGNITFENKARNGTNHQRWQNSWSLRLKPKIAGRRRKVFRWRAEHIMCALWTKKLVRSGVAKDILSVRTGAQRPTL